MVTRQPLNPRYTMMYVQLLLYHYFEIAYNITRNEIKMITNSRVNNIYHVVFRGIRLDTYSYSYKQNVGNASNNNFKKISFDSTRGGVCLPDLTVCPRTILQLADIHRALAGSTRN